MGYCNESVTTLDQLNQVIQRADCCKIIYFGDNQGTFPRIQGAAAVQTNRCCAWLKNKSLLTTLTPPLIAPAGTVAAVIKKNKVNKEWLQESDLGDITSVGLVYDDCI